MYYQPGQLSALLHRLSTVILKLNSNSPLPLKNPFELRPLPGHSEILIDQVRDFLSLVKVRESSSRWFVIWQAEKLNPAASNLLLKALEEPKDHYHFILVTTRPEMLLPTIRSRATLLAPAPSSPLTKVEGEELVLALARQLLTAPVSSLPTLAEQLSKTKDRAYCLEVLSSAIEISYKSYFKTSQSRFLKRLDGLIKAEAAIRQNGNIKLQLVANLC